MALLHDISREVAREEVNRGHEKPDGKDHHQRSQKDLLGRDDADELLVKCQSNVFVQSLVGGVRKHANSYTSRRRRSPTGSFPACADDGLRSRIPIDWRVFGF